MLSFFSSVSLVHAAIRQVIQFGEQSVHGWYTVRFDITILTDKKNGSYLFPYTGFTVRYIDSYFVCFRPPYDLGRMHYVFRLSVRRCVRQCGGILRPACRRLLVPICVRFPRNDWRVRSYLENVGKRKLELLNAEKNTARAGGTGNGSVPIQSAQCRFLG